VGFLPAVLVRSVLGYLATLDLQKASVFGTNTVFF
jgi:hypothetical protein